MKAQVLTLDQVGAAEERAWRQLAERAAVPHVWSDPRFILPALAWGAMADGMRLVVVVDETQAALTWDALLAVEIQRPVRRIPLTVTTAHGRFMSWHADRRHPLIAQGRIAQALPPLIQAARLLSTSGTLRMGEVPVDDAWEQALTAAAGEGSVRHYDPRAMMQTFRSTPETTRLRDQQGIVLPQSAQAVLEAADWVATRTRSRLKGYARRLERDTGTAVNVIDMSDDPHAATTFVELQGKGWKGDPNRGGAGLVLDDQYAAWFVEVVERFRPDGDLAIFAVTVADQVLAMQVALRSGSTWIGFVDTYDEDYGQYRLGNMSRVLCATLLTLDGQTVFDSGMSVREDENDRPYWHTAAVTDVVVAGGVASRAAMRLLDRAERSRDRRDAARAGHTS